MPLAAAAHHSLVDQAIEAMHALLASGEWVVGARIPPEPVLAEELKVGRNTVREAVRALAHAGVLEVHQGDGTYVAAPNEVSGTVRRRAALADESHMLEVRQAIETRAASLAATRRTQVDLRRLERALERRTRAISSGDQAAFVDADVDFHVGVVAAAKNPLLADLYDGFVDLLRVSLDLPGQGNDQLCADHDALLSAIRANDASAASTVARGLLLEVARR